MEKHRKSKITKKLAEKAKGKRLTEKEEDDLLLEGAEEGREVTHLTQQPGIVTGQMRAYQLEGLNWLIRLYTNGVSGILADEMGLGKTLQSISMIAYLRQFQGITGPHLVCVPLTTLGNWEREFNKWCPSIKTYRFHGDKEARVEQRREMSEQGAFDVCLTSYEMGGRERTFLAKFPWNFIVVDEAHRLKNEGSQLSVCLRTFKSTHRLLLTGTPLQNNLHELWALLNFLLPDIFVSATEFDAIFTQKGMEDQVLRSLHEVLRPFMLRRLKSDVERTLLPKKETLVYVGMSALQAKVYKSVLKREFDAICGTCKEKTRLLNIVMQLRKAANHPYLFDGIEDRNLPPYADHLITNSGKISVMDKLLFRLKAQGSRVLIFSQMTRTLDILEDYCIFRGFEYCRIDGSTNATDREESMKIFNAPNSPKFLFLLSTRAGGLGINLATADIVIIYDSDWNPQMDLQAQDRAHRIGQTKQVHIYRLITEDTIEEKIIEKAEIKLRLDAMVIQKGQLSKSSKTMTKEDMAELIRYGADRVLRLTDGTITDADIDAILAKGEQKTAEFMKNVKSKAVGLSTFSLDGSVPKPEEDKDALKLERDKAMLEMESLNDALGKRERKQKYLPGYNVDSYYKTALAAPKSSKCLLMKPHKIPKMNDFQFFDKKRIEMLSEKEMKFFQKYQYAEEPPALCGLSDDQVKELETLLAEGFSDWNKRDFLSFLKACELYGRSDIDHIIRHMDPKPAEAVRKYYDAFWAKYQTITNYERMITQIEKGEARLNKTVKLQNLLKYSVHGDQETRPTFNDFSDTVVLKYKSVHKGRGYTSKEDKFLLYESNMVGYGAWDKLSESCLHHPDFTFDYFLKTRNVAELNRRVDALLRLKEKEYDQATKPAKPKAKKPSESKTAPEQPKKKARQ